MARRVPTIVGVLAAVALATAAPASSAADLSHARIVRLSYVQGDVQISSSDNSGWQKAIVNTPLREGTTLATGDGRAEVEFESGATAWISANTVLQLSQLALEDGAKLSQLNVTQGTATFYVNPGRHDSFVVRAGQLQMRVADSSRFRLDVFEDGASVSVLRGKLDVDVHGNIQQVTKDRTLGFRYDTPSDVSLDRSPTADAWDRWVAQRADALESERGDAYQYARTPISYGMADLSYYGGWQTLAGYGNVWQPWGTGLGWSPFSLGYWSNFGPWGFTWVSFEPWGWLPYHYGGWVFSPFYGWVWAPGNFAAWSPATVHWVRTPTSIGWVPKSPKDPVNGVPVNLSRGVITNSPAGVLAHSPNAVFPVPRNSDVHVIANWNEDAGLMNLRQQVVARQTALGTQTALVAPQTGTALQGDANASGLRENALAWRPGISQKMPQGPAPRLSAGTAPPAGSGVRPGHPASGGNSPSFSRPSPGHGSSAPSAAPSGSHGTSAGSSSPHPSGSGGSHPRP
jgi:hypothetical protein